MNILKTKKRRWLLIAIVAAVVAMAVCLVACIKNKKDRQEATETNPTANPTATPQVTSMATEPTEEITTSEPATQEPTETPEPTATPEPTPEQLTEEEKEEVINLARTWYITNAETYEIDGKTFTTDEDRNIFYEGEFIGNQHHNYNEIIESIGRDNNPSWDDFFVLYHDGSIEGWRQGEMKFSCNFIPEEEPIRIEYVFDVGVIIMTDRTMVDIQGTFETLYEGECAEYQKIVDDEIITVYVWDANYQGIVIDIHKNGEVKYYSYY